MKKLKIDLEHYTTACTDFGCIVKVNDVELKWRNEDLQTILKSILEYLGYEVEVNEIWTDENENLY